MTMIMIENNYYIIFLFCDNFIYVRARHFPTKKFLAHFRTWAFNFLIFRAHGPTQRRSLVTFPYTKPEFHTISGKFLKEIIRALFLKNCAKN